MFVFTSAFCGKITLKNHFFISCTHRDINKANCPFDPTKPPFLKSMQYTMNFSIKKKKNHTVNSCLNKPQHSFLETVPP